MTISKRNNKERCKEPKESRKKEKLHFRTPTKAADRGSWTFGTPPAYRGSKTVHVSQR
jgi:hypothetical protein